MPREIEISKVPVEWHIDHLFLTINEIYKEVEATNPKDYKSRFNLGRTMMFTFDRIPRGSAESSERVRPPETIAMEELEGQLLLGKTNLD